MPSYSVSGIVYARVTDSNLAIATSNSGIGTLEEVITAPSIGTGLISSSTSSTTVQGFSTVFKDEYVAGQYLYAYNKLGEPVLVGEIASVDDDFTITLTQNASSDAVKKAAGSAQITVKNSEPILIRIPIVPYSIKGGVVESCYIPDWTAWRGASISNYNKSEVSSITRYSQAGDELIIDISTPAGQLNVPFTIAPSNIFFDGTLASTCWSNSALLPSYIFAILNPYGNSGQNFSESTMFKLFTATSFSKGILIYQNFPKSTLKDAGYKITIPVDTTAIPGGTVTVGGQ